MTKDKKVYKAYNMPRYRRGSVERYIQDFVREEPFHINLEDSPYAVVMRTPGDEVAHAAGFCLSEGLIDSPEDIKSIDFSRDVDENTVNIYLNGRRKKLASQIIEKQGVVWKTNYGSGSEEMVRDLSHNLKALNDTCRVSYTQVLECVERFLRHQEYYVRTRGTHAVMLFDSRLDIMAKSEDVGRHNAMDKSIGALFLKNSLSDVYLAVLSSRISFEVIQKAARARIPIMISISNPTSMAVKLGLKLNMTLICMDGSSDFIVPSGENRVRTETSA